ncbi:MAG: Gfo/Idh/MocA family oxidoreductase [Myxococcota bacterium]|nr:Gfo/Idh/MocA family oxidoreductase [Myxococcota bacterium]
MTSNFAIIGAAGYVAPRHLKAIRDTGNRLVAAADPHDSVGVLDQYFTDARYFPEIERFDRHLEKLRRKSQADRVDYISICSPNYLHDAHVRLALRLDAHAICEKPLVIKPWNLDYLAKLEEESGRRINTVLQLRVHPAVTALKERLERDDRDKRRHVVLTYVTGRGNWYDVSWKGIEERSGGVAMNIGVHFFDLLLWLFGPADQVDVHTRGPRRIGGTLTLKRADVQWLLSVDFQDLPRAAVQRGKTTYRSIEIDGEEVEFTEGFTDLHTAVYEKTLAGQGFGIEDARPSIELVHRIRHTESNVKRS